MHLFLCSIKRQNAFCINIIAPLGERHLAGFFLLLKSNADLKNLKILRSKLEKDRNFRTIWGLSSLSHKLPTPQEGCQYQQLHSTHKTITAHNSGVLERHLQTPSKSLHRKKRKMAFNIEVRSCARPAEERKTLENKDHR